MKYKYSEIKNKISGLDNPYKKAHREYLLQLINRDIVDIFPDWFNSLEIGGYAFTGCSNLTEVIIPDGVTTIGFGAFTECKNLVSVTLPDSMILISRSAFSYCSSLTNLVIPKNVAEIKLQAFYGCSSLTDIYLHPSIPPILEDTTAFTTNFITAIHVPIGCGETYKTATNWSSFADKIVEDIVIEQEEESNE